MKFCLKSILVFSNLFLLAIIFHPVTVCRHLIHIGHEPFIPTRLQLNSYESLIYKAKDFSSLFFHQDSTIGHDNILIRIWNFLCRCKSKQLTKKYFHPNLLYYTFIYLRDHSLRPIFYSLPLMYISHFLLNYISALVHIYRISLKRNETNTEEIRNQMIRLMESSYARWILNTLVWKTIAILGSHIFYVLAVKIIMQQIFISYGHFTLNEQLLYSWWDIKKNLQLIYQFEHWNALWTGLLTRLIYEFGISTIPRLVWWPIRSLIFRPTIKAYFRATFIELYVIQCFFENLLRFFSIYLQIFARLTTLNIVNHMHEPINRSKYPLLLLTRNHFHQSWFFPISIHPFDAKLLIQGLSVFLRQVD